MNIIKIDRKKSCNLTYNEARHKTRRHKPTKEKARLKKHKELIAMEHHNN
jgi:hypothetical protein